jgi:hypothetical protein
VNVRDTFRDILLNFFANSSRRFRSHV